MIELTCNFLSPKENKLEEKSFYNFPISKDILWYYINN